MANRQNYDQFVTELSNYILNDLGGHILHVSQSSESTYFQVFDQKIRISEHLKSNNGSTYIQIICPMFNINDIIIFYKYVVYVVHDISNVKSVLQSLSIMQEQIKSIKEEQEEYSILDDMQKTIQDMQHQLSTIKTVADELALSQILENKGNKKHTEKLIDVACDRIISETDLDNCGLFTEKQMKVIKSFLQNNLKENLISTETDIAQHTGTYDIVKNIYTKDLNQFIERIQL